MIATIFGRQPHSNICANTKSSGGRRILRLPPLNISPADQIMNNQPLSPTGRASAPQASYNAANCCHANSNPSLAYSSNNFSTLLRFSSPPCFMYQSASPHFNARDGCFSSKHNHHPISPFESKPSEVTSTSPSISNSTFSSGSIGIQSTSCP